MKTIVEKFNHNFKVLELSSCFKIEHSDYIDFLESQVIDKKTGEPKIIECNTHIMMEGHGLLILIVNQ
jgi:hypothetical protein